MKDKAYAKINISLDIVGKRKDGYHLLKMIMQSIDLYDEIDLEIIDKGIEISSDKDFVPLDNSNICYKACELFFKEAKIDKGARIHIKKNIPVSAGLAGGSTDGACVLKLLNKSFDNILDENKLYEIALKLGADVPFCMHGGTALCEGVGEEITQLNDFSDHLLVLIKPPFGVSTKEVFTKFNMDRMKIHPETDAIVEYIKADDLKSVSESLKNVLENVTVNKHKVIRRIKEDFLSCGALGTVMSGSGPSVYGFYDDEKAADKTVKHFSNKYRDIFKIRTIGRY